MRREIHIADILQPLSRDNLLPAIVFRTSRAQCDIDAQRSNTTKRLRLPPLEQRELRKRIHEVIQKYDLDEDLITSHPQYSGLIATGVGAHHAGQLLVWRLLLEELMASGCLRILVATGTVAAGVDFPARTVVITAHSKRGAEGYRTLTPSELQQMSGRAGRRGKDSVGFCLAAPTPFCDARALLKIAKQPPEPLVSAYFPSPSTVLNLLRYRNVDDLRFTVERSLAAFVDRKHAVQLIEESRELAKTLPEGALDEDFQGEISKEEKKVRKKVRRLEKKAEELAGKRSALLDSALNGLSQLGYVERTSLSEKGYWAARLCTSIVLELSEMIEAGLFDGATAERLVILISSIAGDEHRAYMRTKNPPISEEDASELQKILDRVGALQMPGVMSGSKVLPNAACTALTWMQAESWQQFRGLLMLSGVAEGDAARLITQTADHLNQLTRLYDSHPQLALRAEEAKRRILRPPLTDTVALETL